MIQQAEGAYVLLVASNETLSPFIKSYLKDKTACLWVAENLKAARETLWRVRPRIIISEEFLSDGKAIDLANEYRGPNRQTPPHFIILTNEKILESFEPLPDDYLQKPIDLEELYLRLKNIVKTHRQNRQ